MSKRGGLFTILCALRNSPSPLVSFLYRDFARKRIARQSPSLAAMLINANPLTELPIFSAITASPYVQAAVTFDETSVISIAAQVNKVTRRSIVLYLNFHQIIQSVILGFGVSMGRDFVVSYGICG